MKTAKSKLLAKGTQSLRQASKIAKQLYSLIGDSSDANLCYLAGRLVDITERHLPKQKRG